jgi:hypothetical protein
MIFIRVTGQPASSVFYYSIFSFPDLLGLRNLDFVSFEPFQTPTDAIISAIKVVAFGYFDLETSLGTL